MFVYWTNWPDWPNFSIKDTKRLGPTDWEDPNHIFKKNV